MAKALKQRCDVIVSPPIDAQLPATYKPASLKLFRILCRLADSIVDEYDCLNELSRQLSKRKPAEKPPEIEEAQLSEWTLKDLARCRALLHELDRDEYYEVDDEGDHVLKRVVIAKRLVLLSIAQTIGGPKDEEEAAGFSEMMLAHVYDAETNYPALESACLDIEKTEKYFRVIPEVLEKIKIHEDKWHERRLAMAYIEHTSQEVQKLIRKAWQSFELAQAQAKVKSADWRWRSQQGLVRQAKGKLIAAQEAARAAYQQVEEAAANLAEEEQALDEVCAALGDAMAEEEALAKRVGADHA